MSNESVSMRLSLPAELHQRLKVTAVTNGETLAGFVVRLLSGCMGGAQKWSPVRGAEPAQERSDATPRTGSVGSTPTTGAKVKELRWCGKCARQVEDWEMVGGLALCGKCRGES